MGRDPIDFSAGRRRTGPPDPGTEAAQVHRAMQAEIAAQGPRLRDRFNRPILIGGQYEFHDSLPIVLTVVDIRPDLSPNAPPGMWLIDLQAELTLPAMQGQANFALTLVVAPPAEKPAEQPPAEPAATPAEAPAATAPRPDADDPAGASAIVLTDGPPAPVAPVAPSDPHAGEQ